MIPPKTQRKRRVVFVEYDVTRMTEAQVDALLCALTSCKDASFRVEVKHDG
jgi:hypothetical protein